MAPPVLPCCPLGQGEIARLESKGHLVLLWAEGVSSNSCLNLASAFGHLVGSRLSLNGSHGRTFGLQRKPWLRNTGPFAFSINIFPNLKMGTNPE